MLFQRLTLPVLSPIGGKALVLLLLCACFGSASAQVPATPVVVAPSNQTERAMVFPEPSEWTLLNASGITILNTFTSGAEIAATPTALSQLRLTGISLHDLDRPKNAHLRRLSLDPTAAPINVSTHSLINAFPGESHPLVVAAAGVWQPAWTAQLEAQGAVIVGFVPPYGAVIHLPINQLAAVQSLPFVIGVMYLDPVHRIVPRIGTSNPSQFTEMEILLYAGFSPARLQSVLNGVGFPYQVYTIYGRTLIRVSLDQNLALVAASYPEVEWVDDYDPGNTYNHKMRVLVQTDSMALAANQSFYHPIYAMGVNGDTEIISISDSGIRATHEVFVGTSLGLPKVLFNYVPTGSLGVLGDDSGHGSAVACSALGDRIGPVSGGYGFANGQDGLAVGARLIMQDIGNAVDDVALPEDWITEVFLRAYNEGSRIQNSSWGHGNSETNFNGGTYSFRTQLIDQFCDDPDFEDSVQIFAVGNYGGDHQTSPPNVTYQPRSLSDEAHAKNGISVGGHRNGAERNVMYSYSGRGPTNDGPGTGRIKPDLVSVGSGIDTADQYANNAYWTWYGTSHAAPVVAGAVALIRDWFNKGLYAGPALLGPPSSALIKAMLVNATQYEADASGFLGNAGAGLPADSYPNFDQGYGRPVLEGVLDPNGYREVKLYQDATTQLQTGEKWSRTVSMPNPWQNAPCNSLRVTLAWTDEAMALSAGKALVNDLDLQVKFNGVKYKGNARHRQNGLFDGVNNVEDILIPIQTTLPATFSIVVDVLGTSVFSDIAQPFAVVVTYGSCPGTIPCGTPAPCYPGPGDIVPTPNPPVNPCEQIYYSTGEYFPGSPYPYCVPPEPCPPFSAVYERLAGKKGDCLSYKITVPACAKDLEVILIGGEGQFDLFLKKGAEPTEDDYDCRTRRDDGDSSCLIKSAGGSTWFICIRGESDFSGVDLKITYR